MAVTEESKLAKKVEEKDKETKFTEDELKSLSDLQQRYNNGQAEIWSTKSKKVTFRTRTRGIR